MEIFLRIIRMAPVVMLLSGCLWSSNPPPSTPGDPPTCSKGVHVWENYHLRHSDLSPIVVNNSSYTPDLAAWNVEGNPIQLRSSGKGFTITVKDGGDEDSGYLGLASVKVDGNGHIKWGQVTMNRIKLADFGPNAAAHVLAQELGHLLGLDHQRGADDSALDDCQGRGSKWRECLESVEGMTPNAHDFEQLREIYAHVTEGSSPPPVCAGQLVIHSFSATDLGGDHGH